MCVRESWDWLTLLVPFGFLPGLLPPCSVCVCVRVHTWRLLIPQPLQHKVMAGRRRHAVAIQANEEQPARPTQPGALVFTYVAGFIRLRSLTGVEFM